MALRDYQQAAVDACRRRLAESRFSNPIVVIPTGGGKTHVIAELARLAHAKGGRVLVTAHVRELVDQARSKMIREVGIEPGVICAGLDYEQRYDAPITVASIQSLMSPRRWANYIAHGVPRLIVIDECHRVPFRPETQYRKMMEGLREAAAPDNPRFVGLTATPYRTIGGDLVGHRFSIFDTVCYEVGVAELMDRGYLSEVRTVRPESACDRDWSHLRKTSMGEFHPEDANAAMLEFIGPAVNDLVAHGETREAVLVFCVSIEHSERVAEAIRAATGEVVGCLHSKSKAGEREALTQMIADGRLRWLVNCSMLTTGFDAPRLDTIALMRPTCSPGLYYQMIGRGFRLSPDTGKTDCLVLDYGGNIERHGPVNRIRAKRSRKVESGASRPNVCRRCGADHPEDAIYCNFCDEFVGKECLGCGELYPKSQHWPCPTCEWRPEADPPKLAREASDLPIVLRGDFTEARGFYVEQVTDDQHR